MFYFLTCQQNNNGNDTLTIVGILLIVIVLLGMVITSYIDNKAEKKRAKEHQIYLAKHLLFKGQPIHKDGVYFLNRIGLSHEAFGLTSESGIIENVELTYAGHPHCLMTLYVPYYTLYKLVIKIPVTTDNANAIYNDVVRKISSMYFMKHKEEINNEKEKKYLIDMAVGSIQVQLHKNYITATYIDYTSKKEVDEAANKDI